MQPYQNRSWKAKIEKFNISEENIIQGVREEHAEAYNGTHDYFFLDRC